MNDPLQPIRDQVQTTADAIRWACVIESTSPKAGNVHPGKSFADLNYSDFIAAANITADHLPGSHSGLSTRMLECIRECQAQTDTNVNLGIVLLLGPLSVAESFDVESLDKVLTSLDDQDGANIFRAISLAGAGGLDRVDVMDVHETNEPVDIVAAMKLAVDRDRIAVQYASGFDDLLSKVVPVVESAIHQCDDVLAGVAKAHLRLLATSPDSLIGRKNGIEVAAAVQHKAAEVDENDAASVADFDRWLRRDGNRFNPGTTADLIAASLFVLLARDLPFSY